MTNLTERNVGERNLLDLEKLAKAEARIRNMISKERQSFNEFVQAATEFHKPGLTQTKQEIDAVQSGLTDIQQAGVQKALSKIPDATQGAEAVQEASQVTPVAQFTGTDNFFGLVNFNGKYVFGISTWYNKFYRKEIMYHIEINSSFISAVIDDDSKLKINYTKTLQDFLINNRDARTLSGTQLQNYKELINVTIRAEIEMLRNLEALDVLFKAGVDLRRFKKYQTIKNLYDLPDQFEVVKAVQQEQAKAQEAEKQRAAFEQKVKEVIEKLKTADPQVVIEYRNKNPNDWKVLEQHSPLEMERIKQRVLTPRQQTVESTPETSASSASFMSPEPEKGVKTGKGVQCANHVTPYMYKRLSVLLGAAKTGVKNENRAEFTRILDNLMRKKLIDFRARELLLSRFNKI